ETEIGDARFVLRIDDDIRWLEIAVQHALRVRIMNCLRNLACIFRRTLCRQWTIVNNVRERPSLDVIHREVMMSIALTRFVDANNVRMLQMRGGFGLAAEPEHFLFARELPRENHLQ